MYSVFHMVTPTTGFRLTEYDRRSLEQLSEELVCSRTEVVRQGLAALRRDPALRRQIKAENLALAFLARLRDHYGQHSTLDLSVGGGRVPSTATIAGRPLDPAMARVEVREENGFAFIDLIDPNTNVGIRNAYWTELDEAKDLRILLRAIDVYVRVAPTSEPAPHRLPDGRSAVTFEEDDGTIKRIILSPDGTSHLLHDEQQAGWF